MEVDADARRDDVVTLALVVIADVVSIAALVVAVLALRATTGRHRGRYPYK